MIMKVSSATGTEYAVARLPTRQLGLLFIVLVNQASSYNCMLRR